MQNTNIFHFNYSTQFKCLADKCEDHCCSGWRVSINNATKELYEKKAKELSQYVLTDDTGHKIASNKEKNECSQLQGGLCNIHANYGEDYLPDTCYFYPKIIRKIGNRILISSTSSCPEINRIALFEDDPFNIIEYPMDKLPEKISNFKLDNEDEEDVIYVIERFIKEALREDISASQAAMRIVFVGRMLDEYQPEKWAKIIDNLFDISDHNLTQHTETKLRNYDLIQFIVDIKTNTPPRWLKFIETIDSVFIKKKERTSNDVTYSKILNKVKLKNFSSNKKTKQLSEQILRRFLAAELSRTIYPYAGKNGFYCFEKLIPIIYNFAIVRLGLIAYSDNKGNLPSQEVVANMVQTVCRGINHLTRDMVKYYTDKGLANTGLINKILNMELED